MEDCDDVRTETNLMGVRKTLSLLYRLVRAFHTPDDRQKTLKFTRDCVVPTFKSCLIDNLSFYELSTFRDEINKNLTERPLSLLKISDDVDLVTFLPKNDLKVSDGAGKHQKMNEFKGKCDTFMELMNK